MDRSASLTHGAYKPIQKCTVQYCTCMQIGGHWSAPSPPRAHGAYKTVHNRTVLHLHANWRALECSIPSTSPTAKAAVNVSPAPVVSTTSGAGTTCCRISARLAPAVAPALASLERSRDPSEPSFTRTWGTPCSKENTCTAVLCTVLYTAANTRQ